MNAAYEGWRLLPLQQCQHITLFQNTKEQDSHTTLVSGLCKNSKEKSLPLMVLVQHNHPVVELRLQTGYHPNRPWVLAFPSHTLAFQQAPEALDYIQKTWSSLRTSFHDRLAFEEAQRRQPLPRDLLPWLEQQKDDFYKNHPIS